MAVTIFLVLLHVLLLLKSIKSIKNTISIAKSPKIKMAYFSQKDRTCV